MKIMHYVIHAVLNSYYFTKPDRSFSFTQITNVTPTFPFAAENRFVSKIAGRCYMQFSRYFFL